MAGREKKYKKIPLEFKKDVLKYMHNGDVMARYEMGKPSDFPSKYRVLSLPKVRLDLKKKEDAYQFEVMHKMRHRNILRLEAIEEMTVTGEIMFAVFVEPHNGSLLAYLKGLEADKITHSLPSQCLRDIIRQMVLTVELLRVNGYYHGNLSAENMYVSIEDNEVVIKFANFQQKDEDTELESAQLFDWVGLGKVIAQISRAAKTLDPSVSCSVIDHLASKLQALTDSTSLPILKNDTLGDPFFWDPRKRTNFYIHDLQKALKNETFVASVHNYGHWQLPWDSNPTDGVIGAMNAYRRTVLRKDPYDGSDPLAYVMCMSGAYTHKEELVGKVADTTGNKMNVDAAIQKNRPDLCLTLYRLLTGEVAAEEEAAADAAAEEEEAVEMNEDLAN